MQTIRPLVWLLFVFFLLSLASDARGVGCQYRVAPGYLLVGAGWWLLTFALEVAALMLFATKVWPTWGT